MNLYIKQKVFSWGDKFSIYDDMGNTRYYVEGEVLSFGKKLHLYNAMGNEQAFIQQKVLTFLPKYYISRLGTQVAEVIKEFTFFKPWYTVNGLGWEVRGDFWNHEYEITSNGRLIASISKEWMTWGDTYEISFGSDVDVVNALAVVLIIDACIDAAQNN